jgi:hypothetical protein
MIQAVVVGVALTGMSMMSVAESSPSDQAALAGAKSVKAIFDITVGEPKKLLGRLDLIGETADQLVKQGVTPKFVLAFRGPATFYVSTDRSHISPEDNEIADKIAAKIKELSAKSGVRLEQCSVATSKLKVDNATILPEITVVGNSWISIIGYQNQGYSFLPVD